MRHAKAELRDGPVPEHVPRLRERAVHEGRQLQVLTWHERLRGVRGVRNGEAGRLDLSEMPRERVCVQERVLQVQDTKTKQCIDRTVRCRRLAPRRLDMPRLPGERICVEELLLPLPAQQARARDAAARQRGACPTRRLDMPHVREQLLCLEAGLLPVPNEAAAVHRIGCREASAVGLIRQSERRGSCSSRCLAWKSGLDTAKAAVQRDDLELGRTWRSCGAARRWTMRRYWQQHAWCGMHHACMSARAPTRT